MKNEIKMGDYCKPRIDPQHLEDWTVLGFSIGVLCLLVAIIIVGLFKLINP